MNTCKSIKFFDILALIIFPITALAFESGSVRETFSSARRFNDKETTVFIDVGNKEAVLPLRYGLRNMAVGLYGLNNEVVSAIASDGQNILAGTLSGKIALVDANGSALDLNDIVKEKAKKISALGYIPSQGVWLVGGEAKTNQGALFLTINDSSIVGDFQAEAKSAELDRVFSVACNNEGCLIYGAKGYGTKRIAFFDGETITNLTDGLEFNTGSSWKLATDGNDIYVAGIYKDRNAPVEERYITRVYKFVNGRFVKRSNDASMKYKGEARIGLGYAGNKFVLAQRGVSAGQTFSAWEFDSTVFSDISSQFRRVKHKLTFEPIVIGDGNQYFIGGNGLYSSLDNGTTISDGQIQEFGNIDLEAMMFLNGKVILAGRVLRGSMLVETSIEGFNSSAIIETNSVANAGRNNYFKTVKVTPEIDMPANTTIEYSASGDGGEHWESIDSGIHEFTNEGDDLRIKAILSTNDSSISPRIKELLVEFEKPQITSDSTVRLRDTRRTLDIKAIARAIDKFKDKRGVYPIVDGSTAEARNEQLSKFLVDGNFINEMPKDPRYEDDKTLVYDYLSDRTGIMYVLISRLEGIESDWLTDDIDGKPILAELYNYTCNDPVYCRGEGFEENVVSGGQVFPEARGTAEIVFGRDGRVWRIATTAEGIKQKIYIPSPSVVEKLKSFYARMRSAGNDELENMPRARLVKEQDKADVYYITETFLKRWIPKWEVFTSYGNRAKDIVIIKKEELAEYGEANLIRLMGDSRVWVLEGGTRRYIPNPQKFEERGFKWKNVAPVNLTEFNIYPEGYSL